MSWATQGRNTCVSRYRNALLKVNLLWIHGRTEAEKVIVDFQPHVHFVLKVSRDVQNCEDVTQKSFKDQWIANASSPFESMKLQIYVELTVKYRRATGLYKLSPDGRTWSKLGEY